MYRSRLAGCPQRSDAGLRETPEDVCVNPRGIGGSEWWWQFVGNIYICLYVGRSQMEYVCWVEAMDYDGLAMYECGWAVRLIAVEGCRGARWECGERELSRAGGWEINQR